MIRPNKRRFTFATYLLSGFLPWGRDFRREGQAPTIGRHRDAGGRNWPLCCGHVMTDKEVETWIAEGLAVEAEPGAQGNRRIAAGPNLEAWVASAWERMAPRWNAGANT